MSARKAADGPIKERSDREERNSAHEPMRKLDDGLDLLRPGNYFTVTERPVIPAARA